jgi:hypothetical protein
MKTLRTTLALLALAALAGCGDHALVLKVDILSYLDEAAATFPFGPIPAVPGGLATGEQTLVPDREVNLLEGLSDVADVQSVTFSVAAIVRDSTGSGEDTMRVYMSDAATAPRATPPVLVLPLVLVPGRTDTVAVATDGDARVRALFAQRRLRLEVTTSLRGPAGGADLNGSVRLDALDAVVVAKRAL